MFCSELLITHPINLAHLIIFYIMIVGGMIQSSMSNPYTKIFEMKLLKFYIPNKWNLSSSNSYILRYHCLTIYWYSTEPKFQLAVKALNCLYKACYLCLTASSPFDYLKFSICLLVMHVSINRFVSFRFLLFSRKIRHSL